MDKDDIEIQFDDAPASQEPEIIVEKTDSSKEELTAGDAVQKLQQQLDRERAARLSADRRAREAETAAHNARNEAHQSNVYLVSNSLTAINQQTEMLKAEYRDAMSVGDYTRAADLQQEMAANAAKALQLEQGKQALESQPRPTQQPYQGDPVEVIASQLSPRSAQWLRAHPEYATDQRLLRKMVAAHDLVISDGIPVDSDEYFAEVESMLRIRPKAETPYEDPTGQAAQVTQRRVSPAAAPVSRSGTEPGKRPNTVRLTAAQVEMAEMMGMTPQEYAKNLMALQKEGKIN